MVQVKAIRVRQFALKVVNEKLCQLQEQGNRVRGVFPLMATSGLYAILVEYDTPEPEEEEPLRPYV